MYISHAWESRGVSGEVNSILALSITGWGRGGAVYSLQRNILNRPGHVLTNHRAGRAAIEASGRLRSRTDLLEIKNPLSLGGEELKEWEMETRGRVVRMEKTDTVRGKESN